MGMMPHGGAPMQQQFGAPGAHGPVGNVRNPIVMLLVGMICAPYLLFVMYSALNELKAFRQKDDFNPILFILLWVVFVWQLPDKVREAKAMAGIQNPQTASAIMYFLLGPYFFLSDLNEIWQAAGGGRPAG
jgi:hypothetical protein